jgi:hypothetical protein
MDVIIDDRLLLAVLLRREPGGLAKLRRHGELFTTGLWYHRLCRAVGGRRVSGRLSGALSEAPSGAATAALASVIDLPATIRLISLRDLAWPMGRMVHDHRLNLMGLEALCAARRVNATICVEDRNDSPGLVAAAADVGVTLVQLAA